MKKDWWEYTRILGKRIYRPVKPVMNPLLKRIKLSYVLGGMVGLGLVGSFWQVSAIFKAQEGLAWWPWSASKHAEMALMWLDNGNEEMAVRELEAANRWVVWENSGLREKLKKSEEKVREPGKIRQEMASWEKVVEEKPYYRDVLLRLAVLSYRLYEDEKAEEYWKRANYLDPNNEEVMKIGEIISSR